jgi:UDP-N-acetylglucosamine--N-acetylmuramyl-(pentapeptide) pyrophosphoryl-undecaprenol N-acetylglucosamine transferase
MVKPVVIAAGGTGGHLFPAEALAAELVARGQGIVLMTDARSGGLASPVFAGRESFILPGMGVFGKGPLHAARALAVIAGGALKARSILSGLDASVLVGFGGYPCVAPVLGARMLRRRPHLLLHEQNAVLGRANRLLARLVDTVALSHPATIRVPGTARSVVSGNPVRAGIAALAGQGYRRPHEAIRLLVLGGSLGARVFSDVLPAALALLAPQHRARIAVMQQCRPEDLDRVRAAYAAAGIRAELSSFFADMAGKFAAAHLVISRAGATTVAELAVAGRPAIFVPLPIAIDDDQTLNARTLVAAGGAILMPQPTFTPAALACRLDSLFSDPQQLAAMAENAAGQGHADAASRLADLVEHFIQQEQPA